MRRSKRGTTTEPVHFLHRVLSRYKYREGSTTEVSLEVIGTLMAFVVVLDQSVVVEGSLE
uniref:Uncharacterized protein n=1 Tax=Peronospora matthiolae TaxID=2874970 RepID=A0AAV1V3W6_9STRA